MRRILYPAIPVIVAAAVIALGSAPVRAQQAHDHDAMSAAGQGCACCQKSGTDAKDHAAGGCCSHMAMNHAAADHTAADHTAADHTAADHSAADHAGMNHDAPAADMKTMDHGSGCCSHMAGMSMPAANQNPAPAASAPAFAMTGAPSGCTADGAAAAKADGAPAAKAGGGCCANMASMKDGGGCCSNMAGMKRDAAAPAADVQPQAVAGCCAKK
jgi:hypothetical protein